jgi:uncharacterized protein
LLVQNDALARILDRAPALDLPNWYLGAGCIAQTVWNVCCGLPAGRAIDDYDLVYYDAADLSAETEARQQERAAALFGDLGVSIDLKNEARVHLWYESHFDSAIAPYRSVEAAIDCWPTTATAIGVRRLGTAPIVYAPFGLDDLLNLIVRPNRRQINEQIYRAKVRRWITEWPALTVLPWDDSSSRSE